MSYDPLAIDPEATSLDTGVLIEGLTSTSAGESAAFRVLVHTGATVHAAAGGWRQIVLPDVTALRGAIYTAAIATNGWQPHEQPSPAAYLPLLWSDLDRFGASEGRALYVQNTPRHGRTSCFFHPRAGESFAWVVTRPEELRHAARRLAAATGAAARDVASMLVAMIRAQQVRLTGVAA